MGSLFPSLTDVFASSTVYSTAIFNYLGLAIISLSVGVTAVTVALLLFMRKVNGSIRTVGGQRRRGGRRRRR